MNSHPRRPWEVPTLRAFRSGSGGAGLTAFSVVATVAGHARSRPRRWMRRFFYVSVMLGVAMMSASVIARVFLTENPLGGTDGLFALYGETAAIALGLVVLRVLRERATS